jgi:hypothetical protein
MLGTKFSAIAMAAVRIAAAGAVGRAALTGAVLIVGPALPGHRIELWVSTQPQNLAFITGFCCKASARFWHPDPTGMCELQVECNFESAAAGGRSTTG